jgi:hypothetical protein
VHLDWAFRDFGVRVQSCATGMQVPQGYSHVDGK